jgi:YbgC/YbaW family acyl-CoA thioester hydrolase
MEKDEIVFTHPLEVGAEHLEPLYNHVNHAQALRFMELARLAYLEAVGVPNEALIAQKLFIVIAEISVAYKREIFGGPIVITCESPHIDGKAVLLHQRIINERGKVCVEASFDLRLLSGETKRSVSPPTEFSTRFLDGGARRWNKCLD